MIVTTTNSVEDHRVTAYHGVVVGEAIMGANIVRDLFASVRDVVGGRAGAYEAKLQDARNIALQELEERAQAVGGNAVVGVDLDYEVVGDSMLMVSASGTAVSVKRAAANASPPVAQAPAAKPAPPAPRPAPKPDVDAAEPGLPFFPGVEITVANIEGKRVLFGTDMERDPIQRNHRRGDFYEYGELKLLRNLVDPGGVFVDIGANTGNHSLFAAMFMGMSKVIPFEPNPLAYRLLQLNTLLNNVDDIVVLDHLGLGLADREADGYGMEARDRNLGAARMLEGTGDIPVSTGDAQLADITPTVIKIDVEGMEMRVLQGLEQTIARAQPVMLVEVDQENYDAFEALLERLNYDVAKTIQRYKSNRNYLVVPRRDAGKGD